MKCGFDGVIKGKVDIDLAVLYMVMGDIALAILIWLVHYEFRVIEQFIIKAEVARSHFSLLNRDKTKQKNNSPHQLASGPKFQHHSDLECRY